MFRASSTIASADGLFRKYRVVFIDGKALCLPHGDRRPVEDLVSQRRHERENAEKARRRSAFMATSTSNSPVATPALAEWPRASGWTISPSIAPRPRWQAAALRGRQYGHRPRHGSGRRLPLQTAADAQDIRRLRRDALSSRRQGKETGGLVGTVPVNTSLDPDDWDELRAHAHRMLDDMIDYLATVRERPVWQPIPDDVRERFHAPLPRTPNHCTTSIANSSRHPALCDRQHASGIHGMGSRRRHASGMLAEMLAGRRQRQSRRTRPHADRG